MHKFSQAVLITALLLILVALVLGLGIGYLE